MISQLFRFFVRLMIYQIVFFNVYTKVENMERASIELKDRFYLNSGHFGVQGEMIDNLFKDPVLVNNVLVGAEVAFAVLALFGARFGAFFSAILFILHTLLTHNPLLPENQTNNLFGIKFEFFLHVGVVLVMLVDCFRSSSVRITKEVNNADARNVNPGSNSKKAKKAM